MRNAGHVGFIPEVLARWKNADGLELRELVNPFTKRTFVEVRCGDIARDVYPPNWLDRAARFFDPVTYKDKIDSAVSAVLRERRRRREVNMSSRDACKRVADTFRLKEVEPYPPPPPPPRGFDGTASPKSGVS